MLWIIARLSPSADVESVVGDTLEELHRIEHIRGRWAAHRWLVQELTLVVASAWRRRRDGSIPLTAVAAPPNREGLTPTLWQDARYAVRLIRKAPGFSAVVVLTLALGIGATSAMFAVVNGVLLKPLPFADPDRLMLVHLTVSDPHTPGPPREVVWSYPKYRTFVDVQRVFEESALFASRMLDLSGDGEPERVYGEVVSTRYPAVLGIVPAAGRAFSRDEADTPGQSPVAMISHALWTRRYGADPSMVGRVMQINRVPHTVVGVLPRAFRGLTGQAEVWVPLGTFEPIMLDEPLSHAYFLVARRQRDVSGTAALARVRELGARIDAAYARAGETPWGATAMSLSDSRVDPDVKRVTLVLFAAVGCVLLIGCTNLANLIGTRASARRREVAVRVAIGASRGRVVRQFLVEGLALAAAGAAAGLLVAIGVLAAAARLLPDPDVFFQTGLAHGMSRIPGAAGLTRIGASTVGLDATTLLFTCATAAVVAVLLSLLPARQAWSVRPFEAIKSGGSHRRARFRKLDTRAALVMLQVALAVVLLAGAGLMIRSAQQLRATDIGADLNGLLTLRLELPRTSYDNVRGLAFFDQLLARVRAIPGARSAALGLCPPVSGGCNLTALWFPPAKPRPVGGDPLVGIHWVTPEYFDTLGIRLVRGRVFHDRDRVGQPKVALVSETAARAIWPGDSPMGRRIALGQGGFADGAEVIGIVADVRYRAIESAPIPDVYVPLAQSYRSGMRVFVRGAVDPRTLVPAITREVHRLDPGLAVTGIKTMDERRDDAMWRTRVSAWLLSAFATLALALTTIGIFGALSQMVVQRTAEIGIRLALGARPAELQRLVLGRAALITAMGLAIGLIGALALSRAVAALLYETPPNDPVTLTLVAVLLGASALLAGYLPARRATRVDAITALRAD
jgi:predicted permease